MMITQDSFYNLFVFVCLSVNIQFYLSHMDTGANKKKQMAVSSEKSFFVLVVLNIQGSLTKKNVYFQSKFVLYSFVTTDIM